MVGMDPVVDLFFGLVLFGVEEDWTGYPNVLLVSYPTRGDYDTSLPIHPTYGLNMPPPPFSHSLDASRGTASTPYSSPFVGMS